MVRPQAFARSSLRAVSATRSLRKNIGANFLGEIWTAVTRLAVIPIYLKILGVEGYGLLGFYATLQATLQILDFGLSPTVNRELARFTASGEVADARDFVKTLQTFYWAVGAVIGVVVWGAAPAIARHWIHVSSLPIGQVIAAVRLMAVLVTFQWPISFYSGGLIGLQRQALFNAIRIPIVTIASGGAVLVLLFLSRTVPAFLTWQILANGLYVALMMAALWQQLKSDAPSRTRWSAVTRIWRFAAGMTGISVSSIVLTQLDKIILVKILPLREFGYYALATAVAGGLYLVVASIFNGIFPRFSFVIAQNDEAELRSLYRRGTQLMAVGITPAAAVMILHSSALIFAWTGDAIVAANTSPLIAIIAAGTALNGLMNLPYALQLAYGWTRIGVGINLSLVVLLVPAILIVAPRFGAVGGASVWLTLNVIYMLVGVPMTHRHKLKGESARWFLRDVGPTVIGALVGAYLVTLAVSGTLTRTAAVMEVVGAFVLSTALAAALTPVARETGRQLFRQLLREAVAS